MYDLCKKKKRSLCGNVLFYVLLRTKLQQQNSQLDELERQRAEIAELHQVSRHNLHLASPAVGVPKRTKNHMPEINVIFFFSLLVQQQNQDLQVQLGTLSHSESDLMETNQRLRETLDRVREELRTARTQAEKSQQEAERFISALSSNEYARNMHKALSLFCIYHYYCQTIALI